MSAKPGATDWTPGRGDYGADHCTDIIELVEELNCSTGRGCIHAGTRATIAEFGPGGNCGVLAMVVIADTPIPELDPQDEGPVCQRYAERPEPVRRGMRTPKGIEPLFEVTR